MRAFWRGCIVLETNRRVTASRNNLEPTMCKCTKPEPKLIRTEKHCDRVISVYSDGRRVTNFLPRCA